MYTDVFCFDQCRYMFDILPTFDLYNDFFKNNIPLQIIVRVCIDILLRKHYSLDKNFFNGGFIETMYWDKVPSSYLMERELVKLN